MIRPYQDRAFERFGRHTFQMSDEFYLDAGIDPPGGGLFTTAIRSTTTVSA